MEIGPSTQGLRRGLMSAIRNPAAMKNNDLTVPLKNGRYDRKGGYKGYPKSWGTWKHGQPKVRLGRVAETSFRRNSRPPTRIEAPRRSANRGKTRLGIERRLEGRRGQSAHALINAPERPRTGKRIGHFRGRRPDHAELGHHEISSRGQPLRHFEIFGAATGKLVFLLPPPVRRWRNRRAGLALENRDCPRAALERPRPLAGGARGPIIEIDPEHFDVSCGHFRPRHD